MISFAADLQGTLYKYRGEMMWRLDLADYDDVKANAAIIYSMITPPAQMPPPPFPPFSAAFVEDFQTWIGEGYSP